MTGVEAKAASSVMVVRESELGLEVCCVLRHPKLRAWGGVVAFPGGKVEEEDFDPGFCPLATEVHPRVFLFGSSVEMERAAVVAAVRECFEEVSFLPVPLGQDELDALRKQYRAKGGFLQSVRSAGLKLDLGCLWPVARWITPRGQPIRFDARFFVMRVPPGQVGSCDREESLECFWSLPREILERFDRREVELLPPTQWMLHMLSNFNTIEALRCFVEHQPIYSITPELVEQAGQSRLILPLTPDFLSRDQEGRHLPFYDFFEGRFLLNMKSWVAYLSKLKQIDDL